MFKVSKLWVTVFSILVLLAAAFPGCITVVPQGDGNQDQQSTSDEQSLDKPVITQFSADPSAINSGQSAKLSWSVTNADTVTIEPGIGAVALSGSTSVSPGATMKYTITATNSAGSTVATTEVAIALTPPSETPPDSTTPSGPPTIVIGTPPEITVFTADPDAVLLGGSSTLTWDVSNASSVEISGIGAVAPAGTQSVSPVTTTSYTLTATNAYGWRSKSISITVSTVPLIEIQPGPMIVLKPDLEATYITRQSLTNYTASVKNNGAVASEACKMQIKSTSSFKDITCPAIAAGETASIPFTFAQDPGCGMGSSDFKITIVVDVADSVVEFDEENNKFTRTFNCY